MTSNLIICTECNQPAEYIYKGDSLCSTHFEAKRSNGTTEESRYEALLGDYQGNKKSLEWFWTCISKQSNPVTFNMKNYYLSQVNNYVNGNDICKTAIDFALNIAVRKNIFTVKYIIGIMANKQASINDMPVIDPSDDIFIQLPKNS